MSRAFNANPNGVTRALLRDLGADYRAEGASAIAGLRKNEPRNYLRLILSLPYAEPQTNPSMLDDEELYSLIERAKEALSQIDAWEKEAAEAGEAASPEAALAQLDGGG